MVTTGSDQPDIVVPGYATMDTWTDKGDMPVTDLWVELDDESAAIPMPPGPKGPPGGPGHPKATFVKMGTLANEAARPSVLGPGGRGYWWHRLDTNGMDVWTGTEWKHSPNAVGPAGIVAKNNTLASLPVLRDEKYTMAAAVVKGRKADAQTIQYTVPAGERGLRGPTGNIFGTALTESPDYDDTYGPVNGSMFAYARQTRRFRSLSRPANGHGPYHFGATNFSGPVQVPPVEEAVVHPAVENVASLSIPPMPFAWRPIVWGMLRTCMYTGTLFAPEPPPLRTLVRINEGSGEIVGQFANTMPTGKFDVSNREIDGQIVPFFGDTKPVRIRASGGYGVVPAYSSVDLLVNVELPSGSAYYGWGTSGAYLDVWCLPVNNDSGVAERKPEPNNYSEGGWI